MRNIQQMSIDEIVRGGDGEEHLSISRTKFSSEESLRTKQSCVWKWRKAPRGPLSFSDCKSSISSVTDSDYDAWLANFYDELYSQENRDKFVDKAQDTDDYGQKSAIIKRSHVLSQFPARESTKYWGIKESRRHWPLIKSAKKCFLFPSIHPLLNVSSRYGRYLSIIHSTSAKTEEEDKKRLCDAFKINLLKAKINSYELAKLILCDNLLSLSWYDLVTKRIIIAALCQFLRSQRHLEIVSFENAQLQKLEGIVLLCALSRNGGEVVKELHMWRMFAYGQCPALKDVCSLPAQRKNGITRNVDLNYHFMEILNNFSNLTHLSINYAYLANSDGDVLLRFRTICSGNLKELRLLCLSEERPLLTNPDYGVGGYQITDGVWKRARQLNPKMRVMIVFINMPQYENIILFLSKSIPLASFYLSSGIDLNFENPWEIDTTLLELRNWYSSTLDTLCLHLWHHRDLLDYVIEYRILDEFPNLSSFEFIGVLKCLKTLEGFCKKLLSRKYTFQIGHPLLYLGKYVTFDIYTFLSHKERAITYFVRIFFLLIGNSFNTFAFAQVDQLSLCNVVQKMEGTSVIVSVGNLPPYVDLIYKNGKASLQGYLGKIWKLLQKRLHFTSEFVSEDFRDGIFYLKNGHRDVILYPAIISSEDTENFNFTSPLLSSWYSIYIKDSDEANSSASFIRNWSLGLWASTFLTVIMFTLLLYIMLNISYHFLKREIIKVPKEEKSLNRIRSKIFEYYTLKILNEGSLGYCFITALAAFCSQGCNLSTHTISVRMLLFTFLIFAMIMCNSYSALLVSQLTLRERFLPFDSLDQIPTEASDYSLCVRENGLPYKYFTVNATSNRLKKKWAPIVNKKPCVKGTVPADVMCASKIAFLETPAIMRESISKNFKCKITHLKGKYFKVEFTILYKSLNKQAKNKIDSELLRYREVGILRYLITRYVRQEDLVSPAEDPVLQVTFDHIHGVLLVYAFCIGFSFSLFLIEILYSYATNHFMHHRTKNKRVNLFLT